MRVGFQFARLAALAILTVWTPTALAEASRSVEAETLFQEGKRLLDRKDFALACPKLAESLRIDPGTGTLLALAICHEGEGKLASARAEYADAAARAKREGRRDREQAALQWAAALEPRLSTLTIRVGSAIAARAGVEIRRDGVPIGATAWGMAVPVDPGTHVVEVSDFGKSVWTRTVTVRPNADHATLEVVAVEEMRAEPSPSPNASPPTEPPDPGKRTLRWAGVATAGAGIAALGVGTFFGVQAISKYDESNRGCSGNVCNPEARQVRLDARSAGNISTVAVLAGGALVAGGVVMYVAARPAPSKGRTARAGLSLGGAGGLGLVVAGTF